MKLLKLIPALFFAFAMTACAGEETTEPIQEENTGIPEAVQAKFNAQYGNIENVKWMDGKDHFGAEFEKDGMETEVVYDAKGNVVMTEVEIDPTTVPDAITAYVAENYPDASIEEADKITEGDKVMYEVELEVNAEEGEKELELIFDGEGNYLQQEVDDDDNDDDDEGHDDDGGEHGDHDGHDHD